VAALGLAGADLVGLIRDGAGDPASPQVGTVGAGAVGLISAHPVRPVLYYLLWSQELAADPLVPLHPATAVTLAAP
jgi:hypothetical protein